MQFSFSANNICTDDLSENEEGFEDYDSDCSFVPEDTFAYLSDERSTTSQ